MSEGSAGGWLTREAMETLTVLGRQRNVGKAETGLGTHCCLHPSGVQLVSCPLGAPQSLRSWRLQVARGEVVAWCHVTSCLCQGTGVHVDIQAIQEWLNCSLVGADCVETF